MSDDLSVVEFGKVHLRSRFDCPCFTVHLLENSRITHHKNQQVVVRNQSNELRGLYAHRNAHKRTQKDRDGYRWIGTDTAVLGLIGE